MPLPKLPVPPEEPLYRLILRTMTVIAVYVIAVPAWLVCWISVIWGASDASRGKSPAGLYTFAAFCWLVGTVVLVGGLSLAVYLRQRKSFDAQLSGSSYLVKNYGVPGYLTLPVQAQIWSFVFGATYFVARPIALMIEGFGVWAEVALALVALLTLVLGIGLLDLRVGTAFRQWMRRFYADEPLLLANDAGVVSADWGPIAWGDIKDIRYQVIRIAKNTIPIIAFDLVKPPAPDEARAKWAHQFYYGEALAIRLKDAIEPAADILDRLKGMPALSRQAPPRNDT